MGNVQDKASPDLDPWTTAEAFPGNEHMFKPGDMVEFKRDRYEHWGVYMGKWQVAHVTGRDIPDGLTSYQFFGAASTAVSKVIAGSIGPMKDLPSVGKAFIEMGGEHLFQSDSLDKFPPGKYFIRLDDITEVAGHGGEFRVNNLPHLKNRYSERTVEEMFALLKDDVDAEYNYSLGKRNCQHYATYLKFRDAPDGKT